MFAGLKARYEKAKGQRLNTQQIVDAIWDEFDGIQGHIIYAICEIRESLSILEKIALKDNPLSTVEYIDILIRAETSDKKPGWQDRVNALDDLRKKAEHLTKITSDDYDPFAEYRNRIEEARKSGVDFGDKDSWTQVAKKYKDTVKGTIKDFCAMQ